MTPSNDLGEVKIQSIHEWLGHLLAATDAPTYNPSATPHRWRESGAMQVRGRGGRPFFENSPNGVRDFAYAWAGMDSEVDSNGMERTRWRKATRSVA